MTRMSRSTLGWFFVNCRKHPILLMYEIIIGRCDSIGIEVVARVLYTSSNVQTLVGLGESRRKYLANLVVTRGRNTVKRLGNRRDYSKGNVLRTMVKMGEFNNSQPSPNNVSAASPPLTVVPVFVSVAAPGGQISSSEQTVQDDTNDSVTTVNRQSSSPVNLPDQTTCNDVTPSIGPSELPADANAVQTCAWLRVNRFQAFETVFANFSAADILRLTRDDLIQICGLANGIRLFNALQSKPPTPKLTLNVALEGGNSLMWHALHLQTRTSGALSSKLITTFNLPSDRLHSVLLQGPQGIHLVASNELVAYMKDDRMFLVEIIRDSSSDRYKLLLKPFFRQIRNDNEARIDNETVH